MKSKSELPFLYIL